MGQSDLPECARIDIHLLNEFLCCPNCNASAWSVADLEARSTENPHGDITCTSCQAQLPVRNGVIVMNTSGQGDLSREVYDTVWQAASGQYDDGNTYAQEADIIAGFDDQIRNRSLLDAGCGDGRLIPIWVSMSPKAMVFFDLSDGIFTARARLLTLQSTIPALFIQGSLDNIPLHANAMDTYWSSGTIPLIPNQEDVIAEAARVARNSIILGVTSNTVLGRIYQHLNLVRPFCRMLNRLGILTPLVWFLAAILRLYCRTMTTIKWAAFPFSKETTRRISDDPGGIEKLRILIAEPFIAPKITRHPDQWYHRKLSDHGFEAEATLSEFLIDYLQFSPKTAARK